MANVAKLGPGTSSIATGGGRPVAGTPGITQTPGGAIEGLAGFGGVRAHSDEPFFNDYPQGQGGNSREHGGNGKMLPEKVSWNQSQDFVEYLEGAITEALKSDTASTMTENNPSQKALALARAIVMYETNSAAMPGQTQTRGASLDLAS